MPRKSLIVIKHGFSETCDHNVSSIVSYGDVFRCTCLLEDFKGWHVTWVSATAAKDLLTGNHLIDQLLLADCPNQIPTGHLANRYDMVINLEKQKDWCGFAESLTADKKYGFKDWTHDGSECFYTDSTHALSNALHRDGYRTLQETLYKTIGREWIGQHYSLGYQPKIPKIYDIGLNNHVGPKWPTKIWANENWKELYNRLNQNYAVSWQQSLNSIRHYIDWLASCRLIITCDSLGLHLALALKNQVVALFGATPPEQIHMYGQGIKLTPTCQQQCVPCFQPRCEFDTKCIDSISVDMVLESVEMLIGQSQNITATEPQLNIDIPEEHTLVASHAANESFNTSYK
ncbi:MAG: hypothetical protein K9M57_09455 [Phycisphaerae bacterium]|nr:hypothetical protein [Phycisphaerae bacterium]